jgi:hypothetical protein
LVPSNQQSGRAINGKLAGSQSNDVKNKNTKSGSSGNRKKVSAAQSQGSGHGQGDGYLHNQQGVQSQIHFSGDSLNGTLDEHEGPSEDDFNVADCSGCGKVGEFKRYYKPGRSYYKPHYIKAALSETGRIKRCGTFTVNPRTDLSFPAKDKGGSRQSSFDGMDIDLEDQDTEDFDLMEGELFDSLVEETREYIADCTVCGKVGEHKRSVSRDADGNEKVEFVPHKNCSGVFSKNPRVKRHTLGEVDEDILMLLAQEPDISNDWTTPAADQNSVGGSGSSSSSSSSSKVVQEPVKSEEEIELLNSISTTRAHIRDYREALENAQLDEALDSWTEAVQVLQKLYHNEQVFLLKLRLLNSQKSAGNTTSSSNK